VINRSDTDPAASSGASESGHFTRPWFSTQRAGRLELSATEKRRVATIDPEPPTSNNRFGVSKTNDVPAGWRSLPQRYSPCGLDLVRFGTGRHG